MRSSLLRAVQVAALLLGLVIWRAADPGNTQELPPVFDELDPGAVRPLREDQPSVRDRFVRFNTGALSVVSAEVRVSLNLFADTTFEAVLRRQPVAWTDSAIWMGQVSGRADTHVSLVARGSALSGSVRVGRTLYEIRQVAPDVHVVRQIEAGMFPLELDPIEVTGPATQPDSHRASVGADDASTIDVMVVYSTSARNAAGGTAGIEALIDNAVAVTNTSYANSGVTQRLRLVHKGEVSYTDSGSLNTDLTRLRSPTDGFIDEVPTLRNTHGADMVSLFVDNGGGFCGLAFLPGTVTASNEGFAFSVVDMDCAVGNRTYAHELGHNMSARHDWIDDSTDNSPFSFNHAHIAPGNAWRTIMGVGSSCSNCPRDPFFSNPDGQNPLRGGASLGVPLTSPQPTDNRRTLNETALTLANYRQAVSQPPAPSPTPTRTPTRTLTPTPTRTPTATLVQATSTSTPTPSPSLTVTPTATLIQTPTSTPTSAAAGTSTPTVQTSTPTATGTPTPTPPPPTGEIGGLGFTLTMAGGRTVSFSWQPGSQQASYTLDRFTPSAGLEQFLVPGGAGATSAADQVPVAEILACYRVQARSASGEILFTSDFLCAIPGFLLGSGPPGLSVRLNESNTAALSWNPALGAASYFVLELITGRSQFLGGNVTSTTDGTGGNVVCYLVLTGGDRSDIACGLPGFSG